jgi:S1-C subfamily serine protease
MPWRRLAPVLLAATLLAPLAPAFADAGDADAAAADSSKQAGESREQSEQRLKQAQERMESAAREMAQLSMQLSDEQGMQHREMFMLQGRRPQLGMAIDMRAGDKDDKQDKGGEGVRVVSVSPGGPAEVAGVRANDVVTSLGGTALKGDARQSAAHQLLAIMGTVKPGESLPIEFRHDGKLVKGKVIPSKPSEQLEDLMLPGLPLGHPMAGMGPGMDNHLGMHDMQIHMFMHQGGFGGTELVELTPGLGSYFGTDKGLLVVRAPADSRFKLQDGDVLLDIDGRVPSGVGHAMQILGSYHPGETVKLHLMRQKLRVELAVAVPDGG